MTTTSNAMQFSPVQSVKHRQGGVQQLLEMRTCDRRQHCPRRRTRAMHQCLFLTQGSLRSSTSSSGFEVLQKCLCSHNCFQEEYPGFRNQAFLHLGLWASLAWKTLTHVRTLTNPSIFFWNESVRARFTKTALWCSVILWRVSPCIETCSIGCLPTLFRKLGQRARRTMSFVSPFITHFFTRNTRN